MWVWCLMISISGFQPDGKGLNPFIHSKFTVIGKGRKGLEFTPLAPLILFQSRTIGSPPRCYRDCCRFDPCLWTHTGLV